MPLLVAAPADAASIARDFNLPEQDLAAAIRAIGRHGRVDILFQPETVAGRRSSVVRGTMDPAAALRLALRAHGDLEVVTLGDGTLLVRRSRVVRPPPRDSKRDEARPPPAEGKPDPADEIVVTASRRVTLLKTYPGSMSVVNGSQVARPGRTSLAEAAAVVPGLNLSETGPGQRRITMRGMHSAGENSVLLYFDETPISGPSSATSDVSQMSPDIRLYDIDRIEVLRGPQGTLFGSGALSGAVRILVNKPRMDDVTVEAAVAGSLTQGGRPGTSAHATLNLPLLPGLLSLRATGYDDRSGGHVDNVALGIADIDRSRTSGGRVMLRLEPDSGYDLTAMLLVQQQRIADSPGWYPALGHDRTDMAERLPFPNDLLLYNLTGHAKLGIVDVTAVASRYSWDVTRTIDSTRPALRVIENGTYCPLFSGVAACNPQQLATYRAYIAGLLPLVGSQPMRVDATIGELRVASAPGEPVTLIGGLFVERRSDASMSGTYRADAATGQPRAELTYLRAIAVETRQFALFADLGWRITDTLTLTIGARRYSYSKHATAQVLETSYVNGAVAGPPVSHATDSVGWTWRANLAYAASPGLLLYAQVATGFRPGGANSVPNLPADLVEFEADSATAYEIGFRGTLAGGRVRASGSAYLTDWNDMQASARLPSFTFVSNSGAARVLGMDFDVEAELSDNFRIRLATNLLDARLTRDQSNSVVAAPGRKGDRIPFEPRLKLAAGAEYHRPIRADITFAATGELSYTGASHSDYRPTSPYYERMGDFADFTLRAEVEGPRWSAGLHLSNVFNVAGKQRVESTVNSEQLTIATVPRTLSLEFRWKWCGAQKNCAAR